MSDNNQSTSTGENKGLNKKFILKIFFIGILVIFIVLAILGFLISKNLLSSALFYLLFAGISYLISLFIVAAKEKEDIKNVLFDIDVLTYAIILSPILMWIGPSIAVLTFKIAYSTIKEPLEFANFLLIVDLLLVITSYALIIWGLFLIATSIPKKGKSPEDVINKEIKKIEKMIKELEKELQNAQVDINKLKNNVQTLKTLITDLFSKLQQLFKS
jgi:glucan phosphoethanolaminetransferase (alkaline phosphatase superfamily)